MRAPTLQVLLAVSLAGCAAMMPPDAPRSTKGELTLLQQFQGTYGAASQLCEALPCPTITVTVGENCNFAPVTTLGVKAGVINATIKWIIDPASAGSPTFTATGINANPPKNTGAWMSEFKTPVPGAKTFTWVDMNPHYVGNQQRQLTYNIEVMQGTTLCKKDPTIVNDY